MKITKPPRRILRSPDRLKTIARERPPKSDPIPPTCYHDGKGDRKRDADTLMVLVAMAAYGRGFGRSSAIQVFAADAAGKDDQ